MDFEEQAWGDDLPVVPIIRGESIFSNIEMLRHQESAVKDLEAPVRAQEAVISSKTSEKSGQGSDTDCVPKQKTQEEAPSSTPSLERVSSLEIEVENEAGVDSRALCGLVEDESLGEVSEDGERAGRPGKQLETRHHLIARNFNRTVTALLKKVEPNHKQRRPRHDIFKTRVVRVVTRMPLELIYMKISPFIRVSDYKASYPAKYTKVFEKTFQFAWKLLHARGLVSGEPTDRAYVHFICLHFPENKVLGVAKGLGLEAEAQSLVNLRKKTSLWAYKEFGSQNTMFVPLIQLLREIALKDSQTFSKSVKMIDMLLKELIE